MSSRRTPPQEMGKCPKCGGELIYGSLSSEDDCIYYEWTCDKCKTKGKEYYNIDFSGHVIEE